MHVYMYLRLESSMHIYLNIYYYSNATTQYAEENCRCLHACACMYILMVKLISLLVLTSVEPVLVWVEYTRQSGSNIVGDNYGSACAVG